jgi:hypothetical protein
LRRTLAALLVCAAAGSQASATVPSCAGVAERGVTTQEARAGRPSPTPTDVPSLPAAFPVTAHPVSFWDAVPDDLFVEIGRPRPEVEALSARDWTRLVERADRAREAELSPSGGRAVGEEVWAQVDRLARSAFERRSIPRGEGEAALQSAAATIDPWPEASWTVPGTTAAEMDEARARRMIAGLLLDQRLGGPAGEPWLGRFWAALPKAQPLGNAEAERRTLRDYLCNEPGTRAEILRAEAAGRAADLARIDARIAAIVQDFDRVRPDLAAGSAERGKLLSVLAPGERARVQRWLEGEGIAKAYVALRTRLARSVQLRGGPEPASLVWPALRPEERFLWNQPCLATFRFEPWLAADPGCDPARAAVSRDRLVERHRVP